MNLEGKRILVTGGTGSLGKTIVRKLLSGELGMPHSVTVFSRDEAKQHYMRLAFMRKEVATDDVIYKHSRDVLRFKIGDVRDLQSVKQAVRGQDVVIHAAALKQVPACEYAPWEAVATNVVGAENLVRALQEPGNTVQTVIGISTDKACKPINVMGMTKAVMERILITANLACPDVKINCVRYGNVIASRGSVVPLFVDQANRGGPMTVTTPDMTRFLLSLDRAADTVFEAIRSGNRGEIFIPRVDSCLIMDLVDVIRDGRDVPITVTGIRPGEKIHEIMVSEEELSRTAERGEYYVILPSLPELNAQLPQKQVLPTEYSSEKITLDKRSLRALIAPYLDGSYE